MKKFINALTKNEWIILAMLGVILLVLYVLKINSEFFFVFTVVSLCIFALQIFEQRVPEFINFIDKIISKKNNSASLREEKGSETK